MATIRDIAKQAGVSVGTASRAITGNGYVSPETRRLVQSVAEQLGYTPREHARPAGGTKTVGVLLPDITFPFYSAFLKYAEVELAQNGYKTVVCNALGIRDRVTEMLEYAEKRELDGLIVNADVTEDEIRRLEKVPVVSFERLLGPKIPMVASDHRQGGQLAAEELLRCGCKNVLIITFRHQNPLFGDIRIGECKRILQEQHVKVTVAEVGGPMLTYPLFKEIAAEYMRLYSGADAIFTDDVMAYCCVQEAKNRGIQIPEQLRILGYDGNEITKIVSPQITTIEQNIAALTQCCVERLLLQIHGEPGEAEKLLPVRLLKGGTT